MIVKTKIATVFGGTGFVGRHIVWDLAQRGYTVKVATRVPAAAYFLRPCGTPGQIVPFECDYGDPHGIRKAVAGADLVVNCIGILYEKRRGGFRKAHVDIPAAIAKACRKDRVRRFVHISALACERSASRYARSKHEGEKAVFKAFPNATILRPGIIFGEDDSFFNMFARMAQILPALPLIGGGKTRFQPVYVGDVAGAAIKALVLPAAGKDSPEGRIYELAGPDILTFKEIYEKMFSYTNQPRVLIPLPFWLAKLQAWFLSILPGPPLTPDQVESLKTDNIPSGKEPELKDLGIRPTSLDLILPEYLESYRPGGRFAGKHV